MPGFKFGGAILKSHKNLDKMLKAIQTAQVGAQN